MTPNKGLQPGPIMRLRVSAQFSDWSFTCLSSQWPEVKRQHFFMSSCVWDPGLGMWRRHYLEPPPESDIQPAESFGKLLYPSYLGATYFGNIGSWSKLPSLSSHSKTNSNSPKNCRDSNLAPKVPASTPCCLEEKVVLRYGRVGGLGLKVDGNMLFNTWTKLYLDHWLLAMTWGCQYRDQ